jgi:hypothetical protein
MNTTRLKEGKAVVRSYSLTQIILEVAMAAAVLDGKENNYRETPILMLLMSAQP